MAAAHNKRGPSETITPDRDSSKRLRQTTLSSLWNLRRGSDTTSPYFASSSSRSPQEKASSGRGRGRGRGRESEGRGKGRKEETESQGAEGSEEIATNFESFASSESSKSTGASFANIDDSSESGSFSFGESSQVSLRLRDSPPPRQLFFPVPAGYRPIRRVNMAAKSPIHYISLQELAFKNMLSPLLPF